MKKKKFSDAIEEINMKYVEEALCYKKKSSWKRRSAIAACLCLAISSSFFLLHQENPEAPSKLASIPIPELAADGMGFEGYLYYNASQLNQGNPWNETMKISTMPVYTNKAYDPSGAGEPKGLSEDEMISLLDYAVAALNAEKLSIEIITSEEKNIHSVPIEIQAETNLGEISVASDGTIVYFLPNGGLSLPEEYSFTYHNTTDNEAYETIAYLSHVYSDLLGMKEPMAVTWGDYNIDGSYSRKYELYDSYGNDTEDILHYSLCSASFSPNDEGELYLIRIKNALLTAEKTGDYPIISLQEAEQRLLAGNYQTSVPLAMPGKEYIAKAELTYRTGYGEEMLLPYYRFYVLLPDMSYDNGLYTYGVYYVPAITEEYIENMPVYDGRFN